LVDKYGCDSFLILTLINQPTIDTSVLVGSEILIATASNSTFQWYDCVNQSIVQGATNDTLFPPESGYYSVIVTSQPEMCKDTSECKFIFTTGISSPDELGFTQVYPNPIQKELFIKFMNFKKEAAIKIYKLDGKMVHSESLRNVKSAKIEVGGLNPGLYILEIISDHKSWHQKIIKE
jgi:hypothetical protein